MFLDSIPSSVSTVFFDTPYIEELHIMNSTMRKLIFGADFESIEWFLYEWSPGAEVAHDGVTKKINDIDEYIDWIVQYEGFE